MPSEPVNLEAMNKAINAILASESAPIRQLRARAEKAERELAELRLIAMEAADDITKKLGISDFLLEIAWGVIANASGGDWTKENKEWQDAAARWRDDWLGFLKGKTPKGYTQSVEFGAVPKSNVSAKSAG